METRHRVVVGDARDLGAVGDDEVELVVTSPPYPMIEMWDDLFADLDPDIGTALDAGEGSVAFELMHEVLKPVWAELKRVLVDGGIACINVGDATRTVGDSFRVYPNHARIITVFEDLGFEPLPDILWRKPSNAVTKFMGSGTLPPNAYVTLEHEYILVFRNGSDRRDFDPGATNRYEAAYFWEERNEWFSDVWSDLGGELQTLEETELRERSGAYPFEIPYRLINMYSVYGDTVLDPFWGTGTTSLAAMVAARNSLGYELDGAFLDRFDRQVHAVPSFAREVLRTRVADHQSFIEDAREGGREFKYEATHYDFPVTTKRERDIRLYDVDRITETDAGYLVTHDPISSA